MSGIYIKGMEMPTNCLFCPICFGANDFCPFVGKRAKTDGRHDGCPLIPVPDHGDLIDRNDMYHLIGASGNCNACDNDAYKCQYYREHCLMDFCERIEDAPTIIPADGKDGAE